jgi:DNA-binding transcriptional LysR family regulator
VSQGRLVPVLPPWQPLPVDLHAVHPSNRFLTPKVRASVDRLREHLAAQVTA